MILNFIIGFIGWLIHLFIKFKESTLKNAKTLDFNTFKDYIKFNKERLMVSFGSYILICVIWFLDNKTTLIPAEIGNYIKSLNPQSVGLVWGMIGYSADSIIRNITKLLQAKTISAEEDK